MNTLYAVLGNTPDLSRLELEAVTSHKVTLILPTVAKLTSIESPEKLGSKLGGTIKLLEIVKDTTVDSLQEDLISIIKESSHRNIALTALSSPGVFTKSDVHTIKKQVLLSRPIRFLSLEVQGHSLVALKKQHVAEYSILSDNGDLKIAQTSYIHDAEDWILRDRNKPYRDIKRGMLPPKLARIMVNLALKGQSGTLSDPFCGTGTVLIEAVLCGASKVIGSDTNETAVAGAVKNLEWVKSVYQDLNFESEFLVEDATHLDNHNFTLDAIATEPYMGPLIETTNLPKFEKIKNIARGLSKLYLGSLRSWHKMLSIGGRVVISIPSFQIGTKTISTLTVDDYARLGYNYIYSVAYGKPGVTVIRNITILEKI